MPTSVHTYSDTVCALYLQAQGWCDDGAYLLASQLVNKFQSKEGAQAALREIETFLEGAPSMLSSGPDILAIEYEAVITPQLQVESTALILYVKRVQYIQCYQHFLANAAAVISVCFSISVLFVDFTSQLNILPLCPSLSVRPRYRKLLRSMQRCSR